MCRRMKDLIMDSLNVFESGSGKWVMIGPDDTEVRYTSDRDQATLFSYTELVSADGFFWEFSIYKNTLHAVRVDGNAQARDCPTVKAFIAERKALQVCDDLYSLLDHPNDGSLL